MPDDRTPISDLERLAKLAIEVKNGTITEDEAITFLACDIVGRSPHLPRITGEQIEALSRLVSGYYLHCRRIEPKIKPRIFEDASGRVSYRRFD